MRVLVVGPSDTRSRGGMATVIREMREDTGLTRRYEMGFHASYIDGNLLTRLLYSGWGYFRFLQIFDRYDLIHIHAAAFGSTFRKGLYIRAAKRRGKRVIFHVHGAEYLDFYDALPPRGKRMVSRIVEDADMVLALSQGWKRELDQRFGLKRCEVLENGIEVEQFAAARTDVWENRKAFLMLGRLGERKGTYDLINAMELAAKRVPDLICYFAGDGETEKAREMVARKQLQQNIKILGWIDAEKKIELLGKTCALVLPSYNEGLPMAILEAMSAGKAVISTDVGAIPEVIEGENGILIRPGDVSALAQALIDLCENREMLEGMARKNIAKATERFSTTGMHQRLADYYEAAMQAKD